MSRTTVPEPRVIDVRPIPKPRRHPLIFEAIQALAIGESLTIENDHNPVPLRGQVDAFYAGQFAWQYLEEGPEVFRLQFTRVANAPVGWEPPGARKSLPMVPASTPAASQAAQAVWVDLLARCGETSHSGPSWAHESDDLDVTLLCWENGRNIEAHVNSEVDVLWIGLEGAGRVTVNGVEQELRPGVALVIPGGSERALESRSPRLSYLSVHRRRRGLMPTIEGRQL